jgi:hypothetical protein
MSTATLSESQYAHSLRNLYFTRTIVQLFWAGIVLVDAISSPLLAAGLLFFYPLWDVACTLYDLRTSARFTSRSSTAQYANVAFGLLAAIGITLTVSRSPQQAVVTFGIWACTAGLAQLAVGTFRRKAFGGQWAIILSGLQSTAAGSVFIVGALNGKIHIKDLGGYAIFGGIYFLVAGFLINRKLAQLSKVVAAVAIALGPLAIALAQTLSAPNS